jgi:hypothetical protein
VGVDTWLHPQEFQSLSGSAEFEPLPHTYLPPERRETAAKGTNTLTQLSNSATRKSARKTVTIIKPNRNPQCSSIWGRTVRSTDLFNSIQFERILSILMFGVNTQQSRLARLADIEKHHLLLPVEP